MKNDGSIKKPDLELQTDEELMVLYQANNHIAFEVLYRRYSGKIYNYMKAKSKSDKKAQDLIQEVFLKLHRFRSQYNKMLPFSPWIFSVARSIFLDDAKKNNVEDLMPTEVFDSMQSVSLVSGAGVDLELLDVLPEQQKQVINMRIVDEATFDEISKRLSITPDNARQTFSRGIKKLKALFQERGN